MPNNYSQDNSRQNNPRPNNSAAYLLALVVMVAVASLTFSELATRSARVQAEQARIAQSLATVAPTEDYDNDPLAAAQDHLHNDKIYRVYPFKKNGRLVGAVIQNETQSAYNGLLRLLVGSDREGKSSGVRVVAHRETPGLGDRLDPKHSDWILQLRGLTADNPWRLEKDGGEIANLTGATISARATLNTAHEALLYFAQELKQSRTQQP